MCMRSTSVVLVWSDEVTVGTWDLGLGALNPWEEEMEGRNTETYGIAHRRPTRQVPRRCLST